MLLLELAITTGLLVALGLGPQFAAASAACSLPAAAGYFCASGYCGCDGPQPHHAAPQCGPSFAELKLGGGTAAERVQLAKRWCDANATCSGFAIDPGFAVTLAFTGRNLTTTAQPNPQWSLFWKGGAQPLPPAPPAPPAPAPPAPWRPILPKGRCTTDEHCSLNGACTGGECVCTTASWRGHNCQHLALEPVPKVAGYGWAPNVSAWGGSIYKNATDSEGLYVGWRLEADHTPTPAHTHTCAHPHRRPHHTGTRAHGHTGTRRPLRRWHQ